MKLKEALEIARVNRPPVKQNVDDYDSFLLWYNDQCKLVKWIIDNRPGWLP